MAGLLINLFSSEITSHIHSHDHWMLPAWVQILSSILILIIIANSLLRLYYPSIFISEESLKNNEANLILSVAGMTCNNCVKSVTNSILDVKNVEDVDVDLITGKASINGDNINIDDAIVAITSLGYSVEVMK